MNTNELFPPTVTPSNGLLPIVIWQQNVQSLAKIFYIAQTFAFNQYVQYTVVYDILQMC